MATVSHVRNDSVSTNTTSYASAAFTPTAGAILVVFVIASGTVAAGDMTGSDGLTFYKATSALAASGVDTLYCFVARQKARAVSQTLTFTCTGDAATGASRITSQVTGMQRVGQSAVRQSKVASNQAAGTPAVTFDASCLTGNPTLGFVGNASNPAGMTPPTDWTEGGDTGYSTPTTGGESALRSSGFTGTTITWGGASATAFGAIILELDTSDAPQGNVKTSGLLDRRRLAA